MPTKTQTQTTWATRALKLEIQGLSKRSLQDCSQIRDIGISQEISAVLPCGHDQTTAMDSGEEEEKYPETETFWPREQDDFVLCQMCTNHFLIVLWLVLLGYCLENTSPYRWAVLWTADMNDSQLRVGRWRRRPENWVQTIFRWTHYDTADRLSTTRSGCRSSEVDWNWWTKCINVAKKSARWELITHYTVCVHGSSSLDYCDVDRRPEGRIEMKQRGRGKIFRSNLWLKVAVPGPNL